MNWVLLSALIGAVLGCCIGATLSILNNRLFKISKQELAGLVAISSFITMIVINMSSVKYRIVDVFLPGQGVSLKLQASVYREIQSLGIEKDLEGKNDGEIQQLVASGIRRLDFEHKLTWNKIRLSMAKNSHGLCAGYWSGVIGQQMVVDGMSSLTEKELNELAFISAKAISMEIKKQEFVSVSAKEVQDTLQLFGKQIHEDKQLKFARTLMDGTKASKEDSCWIMQEIMGYIDKNPKEDTSKVMLSFLAQVLVGV